MDQSPPPPTTTTPTTGNGTGVDNSLSPGSSTGVAVGGVVSGVIVGLLIGVAVIVLLVGLAVGMYRKHQSKDKQKGDTAAMQNGETWGIWGIQSGLHLRSANYTYIRFTHCCMLSCPQGAKSYVPRTNVQVERNLAYGTCKETGTSKDLLTSTYQLMELTKNQAYTVTPIIPVGPNQCYVTTTPSVDPDQLYVTVEGEHQLYATVEGEHLEQNMKLLESNFKLVASY